jgi:hypothetical protein
MLKTEHWDRTTSDMIAGAPVELRYGLTNYYNLVIWVGLNSTHIEPIAGGPTNAE